MFGDDPCEPCKAQQQYPPCDTCFMGIKKETNLIKGDIKNLKSQVKRLIERIGEDET